MKEDRYHIAHYVDRKHIIRTGESFSSKDEAILRIDTLRRAGQYDMCIQISPPKNPTFRIKHGSLKITL